jgi:hypothetical protein
MRVYRDMGDGRLMSLYELREIRGRTRHSLLYIYKEYM